MTRVDSMHLGRLDGFVDMVRSLELPAVSDSRGRLVEFDFRLFPFVPQRAFFISGVPTETIRGGHAHIDCEQVLVCLRGRVTVELVFKNNRAGIELNRPTLALYVAAGVWTQQVYREPDTELLVFASLPYDPSSYVSA